MEKTSEKLSSSILEETLERLKLRDSTTFPVSLFRSKKSGQVLFLEAGKDFVDTLLSFLRLPLGTVHHILTAGIQVRPALGGISNIFESVQNFTASDLQVAKEDLVQPRPAAIRCACKYSGLPMQIALEAALILPSPLQRPGLTGDCYQCSSCKSIALTFKGSGCIPCQLSRGYNYGTCSEGPYSVFAKEPDSYTAGFVKVDTLFIITDSLEIMPLTTTLSERVLTGLTVVSLGNNITVSLRQILQLLHSSLSSTTCLNDVFGKSK